MRETKKYIYIVSVGTRLKGPKLYSAEVIEKTKRKVTFVRLPSSESEAVFSTIQSFPTAPTRLCDFTPADAWRRWLKRAEKYYADATKACRMLRPNIQIARKALAKLEAK